MNILFTVEELAKYLKIKPDTIYKKVRKGELPALKLGKLVRFRKDDIDHWLSQQASKALKEVRAAKEVVETKVEEAVKEVRKKAKIASKVMSDVPEVLETVKKAPLNKKQEAIKKGLKTLWKDLSTEVGKSAVRARTKKVSAAGERKSKKARLE